MVDTLFANFPDAKIDFLVNKRVAEIVSDYPNINKVHAIEKETVSEIKHICKENRFDLAIVVSPRFATALGVFLGGIKKRLGTRNRWYSFLFNIRHAQHRKYSIKHEMGYNLDLLDELTCSSINNLKPVLNVKNEYIEKVRNFLTKRNIDHNLANIVIHIPTLGSAKVWSDNNFVKLIDLLRDLNINIILTGTRKDRPRLDSILGRINRNQRVNIVDSLSLTELAALFKISSLFISNSTGPIHIAAAVGTFVVGIYSPVKVESPVRWGPITDRKKIFVPEKDDNSRDVMDDIKPEEVYEFIKTCLTHSRI
jgi:ADP-heptose:LPS heptosyltransferase